MNIITKGSTLTVQLEDGRTATVVINPNSSLLSRGGRAAILIAENMALSQPTFKS